MQIKQKRLVISSKGYMDWTIPIMKPYFGASKEGR